MRTWDCNDRPEDWLMTSHATAGSTPNRFASTSRPSAAATRCVLFMMLLMTFTAWADPNGPTWLTLPEKVWTSGSTLATSTSSPPNMLVTEPACAPRGPPLTGQSTMAIPFARKCSPTRRVTTGSPDVQSTTVAPKDSTSDNCCATASTSCEVGKHVNITSHPCKSSSVCATCAPLSAAASSARLPVRFQTWAFPPARNTAAHICLLIGRPIAPIPMNATERADGAPATAAGNTPAPSLAAWGKPSACRFVLASA
mmetsp:Transcript_85545/g.228843  ORF Transcript_85545/g.228843 Transcript_85545/m.228843 type:complete len:255 (-) Transcript_85545:97-861(-)